MKIYKLKGLLSCVDIFDSLGNYNEFYVFNDHIGLSASQINNNILENYYNVHSRLIANLSRIFQNYWRPKLNI